MKETIDILNMLVVSQVKAGYNMDGIQYVRMYTKDGSMAKHVDQEIIDRAGKIFLGYLNEHHPDYAQGNGSHGNYQLDVEAEEMSNEHAVYVVKDEEIFEEDIGFSNEDRDAIIQVSPAIANIKFEFAGSGDDGDITGLSVTDIDGKEMDANQLYRKLYSVINDLIGERFGTYWENDGGSEGKFDVNVTKGTLSFEGKKFSTDLVEEHRQFILNENFELEEKQPAPEVPAL